MRMIEPDGTLGAVRIKGLKLSASVKAACLVCALCIANSVLAREVVVQVSENETGCNLRFLARARAAEFPDSPGSVGYALFALSNCPKDVLLGGRTDTRGRFVLHPLSFVFQHKVADWENIGELAGSYAAATIVMKILERSEAYFWVPIQIPRKAYPPDQLFRLLVFEEDELIPVAISDEFHRIESSPDE